mmetsp:Transcript_127889/g.358030  ORF Transcript_127889/g.358030 Transcript_127889/m.358030 type:complete len:276 (+) Transcript_127889:181-1008(+)
MRLLLAGSPKISFIRLELLARHRLAGLKRASNEEAVLASSSSSSSSSPDTPVPVNDSVGWTSQTSRPSDFCAAGLCLCSSSDDSCVIMASDGARSMACGSARSEAGAAFPRLLAGKGTGTSTGRSSMCCLKSSWRGPPDRRSSARTSCSSARDEAQAQQPASSTSPFGIVGLPPLATARLSCSCVWMAACRPSHMDCWAATRRCSMAARLARSSAPPGAGAHRSMSCSALAFSMAGAQDGMAGSQAPSPKNGASGDRSRWHGRAGGSGIVFAMEP